jgi:hypothetical protein
LANSIQKKSKHVCSNTSREFEIGQRVLVSDFRGGKEHWTVGVIVSKLGPVTYRVQVEDYIWKRHVDQIRKNSCESMPQSGVVESSQFDPFITPKSNPVPLFTASEPKPTVVQAI